MYRLGSTYKLIALMKHKQLIRDFLQVRPRPLNGGYNQLFEGLEDDISPSPEAFLPRSSLKKLVLQSNRYSEPDTPDPVETVSKSEQLNIEESSQPGELFQLVYCSLGSCC